MGYIILLSVFIAMVIAAIVIFVIDSWIDAVQALGCILLIIGSLGTLLFGLLTPVSYFDTKTTIYQITEYSEFIDNMHDSALSNTLSDKEKFEINKDIARLKSCRKCTPAFCWFKDEIDKLEYFD